MSLFGKVATNQKVSFPRVSGDEPVCVAAGMSPSEFSPREWG